MRDLSAECPRTRPRNVRTQSRGEERTTTSLSRLRVDHVPARERHGGEREDHREVVTAAQRAVERMRRMWPAHRWGDPGDPHAAAREYGEALVDVGDAGAITRGTTAAIRGVGGRFPPSVADLLAYVRAEASPQPAPALPAEVPNRCPRCAELDEPLEVVVDPRTRIASCVEGLHRHAWRVS